MAESIDFLKAKRSQAILASKSLTSIKASVIVFLIFYCLISAAVFSYGLFLSGSSKSLNTKIESQKKKILALRKVESLYLLTQDRLKAISAFLGQREEKYLDYLTFFERFTSENLVLTDLDFSQAAEITLNGKAQTSIVFGRFVEQLKEEIQNNHYFSEVIISSLSRRPDGGLTFSLRLTKNGQK